MESLSSGFATHPAVKNKCDYSPEAHVLNYVAVVRGRHYPEALHGF